ncbi:IS630 family transposase [Alkalinema pantanalense CENA528]|uniref:IS630 family transposase n=1 Tax=Alkalinema pantanalense TaxID=1620705 RepID=UPI003D6E1B4C
MDKPDARHLSIETQDYLRQQAIRLRQQGKQVNDISEYLGVHRNTVSEWWWQYEHYGDAALSQQVRGRQVGEGRILSPQEESEVQAAIQGHFPEDYEIDHALWTRQAVQLLIAQLCGVTLPIRTVGEYLKRWGYSPKKPVQRAYEQDPKAVENWLNQEYPKIEQQAQQQGGQIEWGDESGVCSTEYGGRGYALIGVKAEIRPSQRKRERVNYIASVDNQGSVRFMVYSCKLDATVFLQFCQRLIAHHPGKLFWIVDRHPVHRQARVQEWLAQHDQQIEMYELPSYCPELNPVEYLNQDTKQLIHDKPPTRHPGQLKRRLLSQLRKLQKLPARVKNYFKHPSIAYAAL